ncbi:MAG: hypothetical protein ABSB76_30365 [Streptosporangiaceae bacterium]
MSRVYREGCLADTRHPADRMDTNDAAGFYAACRGVHERPKLTLPSGKATDIAWQGPSRPGRALELSLYGFAPGGGFEFRANRAGQSQRISEQPSRFFASSEINAAL